MFNFYLFILIILFFFHEWPMHEGGFNLLHVLDLNNVFYVLSFSKNLISISKFVVVGYGFLFENSILIIFKNKGHVGSGTLEQPQQSV